MFFDCPKYFFFILLIEAFLISTAFFAVFH